MSISTKNSTVRGINEQSLTRYSYDCYSGATISIYIGGIWVDDAVSISFSMTDPKAPLYGYNSRYYDMVAYGNRVVQGQLALAYTEEGYLSTILYQHKKMMSEDPDYTGTLLAKSETAKNIWDVRDTYATRQLSKVNAEIKRVTDLINSGSLPEGDLADYKKQLKKLKETKLELERIVGGNYKSTLYTRARVQDLLSDLRGASSYEDLAEILEDSTVDTNKLEALLRDKTRYIDGKPWLTVRGYGGHARLRKALDLDTEEGVTAIERTPYTFAGAGFDIIIAYGDMGTGSAEHTLKTLSDVHLTSESQVIEANGNPIVEVYSFIARDIDDLSDVTRNRSKGLGGRVGGEVPGTAPAPEDAVSKVKVMVHSLQPSGQAGLLLLDVEYPAIGPATPTQTSDATQATADPVKNTGQIALALGYDRGELDSTYNITGVYEEAVQVTFADLEHSTAYSRAVDLFNSIGSPNELYNVHGYRKTLLACAGLGSAGTKQRILRTQDVGPAGAAANLPVDYVKVNVAVASTDGHLYSFVLHEWTHRDYEAGVYTKYDKKTYDAWMASAVDKTSPFTGTSLPQGQSFIIRANGKINTNSYHGSKYFRWAEEYIETAKRLLDDFSLSSEFSFYKAIIQLQYTLPGNRVEHLTIKEI